jgi:hypothetical protein
MSGIVFWFSVVVDFCAISPTLLNHFSSHCTHISAPPPILVPPNSFTRPQTCCYRGGVHLSSCEINNTTEVQRAQGHTPFLPAAERFSLLAFPRTSLSLCLACVHSHMYTVGGVIVSKRCCHRKRTCLSCRVRTDKPQDTKRTYFFRAISSRCFSRNSFRSRLL